MNKQKYWLLLSIPIFTGLVLTSCVEPGPLSPIKNIPTELPVSYSRDQIQTSANCMLQDYGRSLGDWVSEKKRQCTDLARLLTNASGYGLDADNTALGGYEYIQTKEAKGDHIPTLRDVNGLVERCDNLVITGKGFASVGHTVVVYSVDPTKDTIYYLDQNYGSTPEPISFRELDISDNQDNVYVIRSTCKTPTAIPTTTNAGSKCTQIPIQSLDIVDPNTSANQNQTISQVKIAFVSNRDGNYELYVMNEDGSDQTRLTNYQRSVMEPAWSPDGSRIAFLSDHPESDGSFYIKVYTITADGTELKNLTHDGINAASPIWSPDGTKILFVSWYEAPYQAIKVMNSIGNDQEYLTLENGCSFHPIWSPDGTKIMFVSLPNLERASEIFEMNADGSQLSQLTDTIEWEDDLAWSPNGTKITFTSELDENSGIYVMNSDGSQPIRLTNSNGDDREPVWSPDGTKIAYVSDRDGNAEIYVMDSDGTHQLNLTHNIGDDFSPKWSPNGTKIAFVTNRDNDNEIYVMNSDGSQPTRLTNSNGDDWEPVWSPELIQP